MKSISELLILAGQGDQRAMIELVERYSPAPSIVKNSKMPNPTEAFKWVKKLNELGNWQGRHWLADCYFSGHQVGKADPKEAIKLLERNANEGDSKAMVRLAYYYSHGKGVEKNLSRSIEWLEKIVGYQDSRMADENFSRNFRHHPFAYNLDHYHKLNFEFDYKYEEPRYRLAELYIQGGNGIGQNLGKAVEWLERAIEWTGKLSYDGKIRAQIKLGECYLQGGIGLERGTVRAFKLFAEVAAEPYSIYSGLAQRQLALGYALGRGVEQDYAEAIKWFDKAREGCNTHRRYGPEEDRIEAIYREEVVLGICYYRMGENDKSIKYFKLSPRQNDFLGCLWLAYLYSCKNNKILNEINYVPFARFKPKIFNKLTENEKRSIEIDENESKIEELLHKATAGFDSQMRKDFYPDLKVMDFVFSEEIIDFLEVRPNTILSSPAKVILALYYKCKKMKKNI